MNSAERSKDPVPVELQGVIKRYRAFQLGPVDLEVPAGSVTALIGPNGAGKTTLLRMIMGFAAPAQGSVRVLGRTPGPDNATIKASIGFVPEEPFLYDELTPAWHGRFAAAHYPSWDARRYHELLESLAVPAHKKIKDLSKGNRVKAELALALAHAPQILVLDEPTSGLDPLVRREVLDQIGDLVAGGRRAVIFSTHITEDVERIADRVVFLVDGQVRLASERDALRERWQELWVESWALSGGLGSGDRWPAAGTSGVVRVDLAAGGMARVITGDAPATLDRLRKTAPAAIPAGAGGQPGELVLKRRPLRLDEVLELVVAGAPERPAGEAR